MAAATPRRPFSPKMIAALALILIGTLGAIVGFAVDRTVFSPCSGGHDGESKSERHKRRWQEITKSLNLTVDQSARIDIILDEQSEQLEITRLKIEPQMKQIMNTTRARIDSLLTEDQRAKLDAIQKEREARKRRR
jgi:Spy/CpxP family protein refolding chaperone